MIPKSQMYLGARIVENDPEEETPVVPYKGTVTAIEENRKRGNWITLSISGWMMSP